MIKGTNIDLRLVGEKDLDYIYSATTDLSNTGEYWPIMLETKKGFSSEALELFVDFLFKSKQINRLEIETDVNNIGSKRIAEKCGFVVEGIKKQSCFINGRYRDNVIMGLVKEDYFKVETHVK